MAVEPDAARAARSWVPRNRRFAHFDSMRALAVLFVVSIHVGALSGANESAWYGAFTARGNIGVTLFFLISGFLLYRPHVVEHLGGGPTPSVAVYAERRVLRIVPAYWLALTLLATWPGLPGVFTGDWWAYYGFLTSYSADWISKGIPVSWSLSVEVAFYAVLPALAWVLGRLGRGRTQGQKVALELVCLGGLGLASVAGRAWAFSHAPFPIAWTFPFLFFWFALGMGLAVVSAWVDGREADFAFARGIARHGDAVWLVSLGLFVALSLSPAFPRDVERAEYTRAAYLLEHVLFGLVSFGLLLPAVFGEQAGGLVRRLLAMRALDWIGRVSYGVFLWHHAVMLVAAAHLPLHALPVPIFVSTFAVTLGLTCVVAGLSFRFVEQPFMRLRWGA